MQRELKALFRSGDLLPDSRLDAVPYIGPYLSSRMRRAFTPSRRSITVRSFSRAISGMSSAALMDKLRRALQNKRSNQCSLRGKRPHHIPDINVMGLRAMVSLVKLLASGNDGHNLGRAFAFSGNALRLPARRDAVTKESGCLSRRACRDAPGALFSGGLCMPRRAGAVGFPGVAPSPGQMARYHPASVGGRRYVRHPSGKTSWRVPGRVARHGL